MIRPLAVGRPYRAAGEFGESDGAAGKAADIVSAFEAMPAIVWAFSGPEHIVVAANKAARASVGDRPDIIGRPVRLVVPETADQNLWELLDEVYRTGRPHTEQARRVLVDNDDDGELEEGFFDFTALPVCDAAGRVSGVLAHVREVTPAINARRVAGRPDAGKHSGKYDLAYTLQHSLLPTELPVSPGVRVAAQYVAAGHDSEVGGDWFDALLLEDGTVVAAVGDVASGGVGAATAMGQLRSALTAYALERPELVELLDRMDGFARYVPGAAGATVGITLLNPATGGLRYASAGHPPPLVVRADGSTQYLAPASGHPLGLNDEPRLACSDRLEPGEVLVLYSDGAITRPDQPIEQGRSRLAAAARAVVARGADAEATCAHLLAKLTGSRPPPDDIALLVLHRLAEPVPPLRVSAPARPGQLAVLRQRLHEWMDASGISENDAVSVQIAVGEAASNAVEHAYPPDEPGEMYLGVSLMPNGVLHAEVVDRGQWRSPQLGNDRRGRGLPLMRACMDSMELCREDNPGGAGGAARAHGGASGASGAVGAGGGGTTVRMRRRLRRPVGAATPELPRQAAAHADLEVVPAADRVLLRLRGDVDLAATEVISGRVRAATRGGTVAATVDLTRVTHLASAAVRLLFELANDGTRHHQHMIVWVTAGSGAEQVVRLTGLDRIVEVYRRPPHR